MSRSQEFRTDEPKRDSIVATLRRGKIMIPRKTYEEHKHSITKLAQMADLDLRIIEDE